LQDIAITAWSCAKLGYVMTALFAAIENRSDWLIGNRTAQDFADMVWARAKLGHYSPALFAAIDQRSDWLAANATAQEIVDMAWACSMLGHFLRRLLMPRAPCLAEIHQWRRCSSDREYG
jgi:ribosome modulation factor